MKKKSKLVYGVGINDADYNVYEYKTTQGHQTIIWRCPFYVKWTSMLKRCYSQKFKNKSPTYKDCKTVSEWHYFMTFRAWMIQQDWKACRVKQYDVDLLDRINMERTEQAYLYNFGEGK